jgi:hypothetical protein
MARDGRYLFDGRNTPPVRSETDDGVIIDGAAIIAPNGYMVVDLQTVRQFDYLQIHPEWNAQRHFAYRIEASPNGKDWQTVIDKSTSFVHGIQLDELPATQARFLRIRGASFMADVDTLPAAGLSEAAYWQAYDDLIAHAAATDLAIAELALFQKQNQVGVLGEPASPPAFYDLAQNFPNPFSPIPRFAGNPATTIRFTLPQGTHVKLIVYDIHGRQVRVLEDAERAAGEYMQTWNGMDENKIRVASGVYWYRLQVGQNVLTRKMLLVE